MSFRPGDAVVSGLTTGGNESIPLATGESVATMFAEVGLGVESVVGSDGVV